MFSTYCVEMAFVYMRTAGSALDHLYNEMKPRLFPTNYGWNIGATETPVSVICIKSLKYHTKMSTRMAKVYSMRNVKQAMYMLKQNSCSVCPSCSFLLNLMSQRILLLGLLFYLYRNFNTYAKLLEY